MKKKVVAGPGGESPARPEGAAGVAERTGI